MAENGFRTFQGAKTNQQDLQLNTIRLHFSSKIKLNTVKEATQKEDQKLVFKTDYCLMQVKSIAECSKGSILQYFQPSLSIFEWPLRIRFAIAKNPILVVSSCTHMRICIHT